MNIYKTIRINYIKSMKFYLVDIYEDHDVGEYFDFMHRSYSCRITIDTEREVIVLTPNMCDISSYNKAADGSRGDRRTGWGLACQEHFAVIDEEGTVLFSSKGYSRRDRCNPYSEFYVKFQEFIDNGWKVDSPVVLLSDEEDFIV